MNRERICICSNHTENIYEYSKISERINRAYAKKHDYDYYIANYTPKDRAPQWCKIKLINDLLDDEYGHGYIFWIDADAIFNRFDLKIEDIINTSPNTDIFICDDILNSGGRKDAINTGTMIIKNTPWSKNFFKKLWEYNGPYLYNPYHEQNVFEILMKEKDNINHIKVLEADKFNSIFADLFKESINEKYVIHYMALPNTKRVELFNNWINRNENKLV